MNKQRFLCILTFVFASATGFSAASSDQVSAIAATATPSPLTKPAGSPAMTPNELRDALIGSSWTWQRSVFGLLTLSFHRDGSMLVGALQKGKWRPRADRTVVITFPDGKTATLQFDSAITQYKGTIDGDDTLHGTRKP
jgi:hypothetical protein